MKNHLFHPRICTKPSAEVDVPSLSEQGNWDYVISTHNCTMHGMNNKGLGFKV